MAVKSFTLRPGQRLLVEFWQSHERAVVGLDGLGRAHVWNDKCRHRGGPLHLCYRDRHGVLRCPWHDRPVGRRVTSDLVAAIFVRSSQTVTLVSDATGSSPWPVRYLGSEPPAVEQRPRTKAMFGEGPMNGPRARPTVTPRRDSRRSSVAGP